MAEVKILVEGHTTADSGGAESTEPTITLVRDKNVIMVVDPGCLSNKNKLIQSLKNEGLTADDVNFVCLTHSHIDHYMNIGLFPNAKVLEYYGIWHRDTVEDWKEHFTDDIKIIKTPGHRSTGISLLVKTKDGIIGIIGDIFWKENSPEADPYADDNKKLIESRKMVLKLADWIIPGHGKMFKVKK
jgi:glyoxylase-like metal-dependent hydrolase (beta-lactamase superfamily II)